MNSPQRNKSSLPWVFGLLLVAGLGWIGFGEWFGQKDPNALWGTVLLDGKPIGKGQLILLPDEEKGNSGTKAFADIRKGSYSTLPSQPVCPGPCIAYVSVYPDGDGQTDGSLTLSQLTGIQQYQVDLTVPEGGATDFVVRVSSQ